MLINNLMIYISRMLYPGVLTLWCLCSVCYTSCIVMLWEICNFRRWHLYLLALPVLVSMSFHWEQHLKSKSLTWN